MWLFERQKKKQKEIQFDGGHAGGQGISMTAGGKSEKTGGKNVVSLEEKNARGGSDVVERKKQCDRGERMSAIEKA